MQQTCQPCHPFSTTSITTSPTKTVCLRDSFSSIDTKSSVEFQNLLSQLDLPIPKSSPMVISHFFTCDKLSYKDTPDFQNNFLAKSKSGVIFHGWFLNQSSNREILVTWLDQVCLKFELSNRSFSLAMHILDKVSGVYNDEEYETRVMMLLCLSIATKMLETPDKCLTLYSICEFFKFKYSMDIIIEMECCVFAAINYNASGNTTLDFLLFFMSRGIFSQFELDCLQNNQSTALKLRSQELQLLKMCSETLKHPFLNAFSPSIVAASLIFILRNIIGFSNWTDSHKCLTSHSVDDLTKCIGLLTDIDINVYQKAVRLSAENTMCWQYAASTNTIDSDLFINYESDDLHSLDQSIGNDDSLFQVLANISVQPENIPQIREIEDFDHLNGIDATLQGFASMKRVKY